MTDLVPVSFDAIDLDALATAEGRVAVFVAPDGRLGREARRVNRLTRGALERMVADPGFAKRKPGEYTTLSYPAGMAADAVDVVILPRRPTRDEARKAGAALGKLKARAPLLILIGAIARAEDIILGAVLRDYSFDAHKSGAETSDAPERGALRVMATKPEELEAACAAPLAVASGVVFTRDLVSEPANVLTTTEFARRLTELAELGVEVEVLDEEALAQLGMRALLAVGQGSESPSKVVVMRWNGGAATDAPLALIGKGVVFDTGGISLKPAQGMEDMTMDMGGAGVVAGTMKALAARKARANVVGLVGLVENMPDGKAIRPGDIVRTMKGDTVEIINTDAEGRLVLCDVMWYAQDRFKPSAMIDLATLTGACIIALGHENAAVFSNDDVLANGFLRAASEEGEGAWRMPLGQAYDDQLKSPKADMKNVGGRPAGAITAAQYLARFVQEDTPWIHLDIAGVAQTQTETALAPKGATGWGVMALNRLVADRFETAD